MTWTKSTKKQSNLPAVHSALGYCQAAVKKLEKIKLIPALDLKEIEELKAGVPGIDNYKEYDGKRNLERGAEEMTLRDTLSSDDTMTWKIKKLNKQAEKLIGRARGAGK